MLTVSIILETAIAVIAVLAARGSASPRGSIENMCEAKAAWVRHLVEDRWMLADSEALP